MLAYGKGGALESVTGWPTANATGVFFVSQTPEALQAAVKLFEDHRDDFKPHICYLNAKRFGRELSDGASSYSRRVVDDYTRGLLGSKDED